MAGLIQSTSDHQHLVGFQVVKDIEIPVGFVPLSAMTGGHWYQLTTKWGMPKHQKH